MNRPDCTNSPQSTTTRTTATHPKLTPCNTRWHWHRFAMHVGLLKLATMNSGRLSKRDNAEKQRRQQRQQHCDGDTVISERSSSFVRSFVWSVVRCLFTISSHLLTATHSLTQSATHSLSQLVGERPTDERRTVSLPLTHSFTHSLLHSLTLHSLTHSLVTHLTPPSSTQSLNRWPPATPTTLTLRPRRTHTHTHTYTHWR